MRARLATAAIAVLLLLSTSALAQPIPWQPGQEKDIATPANQEAWKAKLSAAKKGPMAKLDSSLIRAWEQRATTKDSDPEEPVLEVLSGRVAIDAIASGDPTDLLTELEAIGLVHGATYGRVVSGMLPIEAMDELAACGQLVQARPASFAKRAGLVTSRGDITQGSDQIRSLYGLDGSGITVGSISDSFDCLGGAAADVASGDLPGGINVLDDSFCPATDEARAMMQIIHDVAPGSAQAMHTAIGGQANLANGILELAFLAGADVIVDDVIYFAEPMFQDGIVAQAVDIVKNAGVAYFSSAGNDGRNSYEGAYQSSGVPGLVGGIRHDFDPGPGVDDLQSLTLGTGVTIFILQWSDPFFSVSGPPGASSDLDAFLYLPNGAFLGIGAATVNIGGDAVEIFGINNPGPPLAVQLGIELFTGPAPALLKYVASGPVTFDEYGTFSSTVYGHPNAAGAESVGAVVWFNHPAFNPNVTSPLLNTFSSAGPTPILFDTAGNPTFELRQKPEICGPDGGNNTFFGFDLPFPVPGTTEPDGFPNFFGTSASAPHAAGVAALLLEANPSLTPGEVYDLLETTAEDMDDRFTPGFDTGFDFGSGFGHLDAQAAVEEAAACKNGKFNVCHTPPGNPANAKTKCISANAVSAHLAQGGKFGPCG